jgi:hypothetical protein
MKRLLLAILILAIGTTVFCTLRAATANTQRELTTQTSAWQTQTQQLAQLRLEKQQVFERWSDTKQQLAAQPPLPALTQLAEKILSGATPQNFSAAESEQLLAELGFSWNTTGDYLIVSKKSLGGISFDGMEGIKLTDVARAVLAITPAEQTAIETLTQQLGEARTAWAKEHVQRTEPSGNVLAQYALPVGEEFARSQQGKFADGVLETLKKERSELLKHFSWSWMQAVGLITKPNFPNVPSEIIPNEPSYQPKPISLMVERYQSGGEWRMNFTLKQAGNSMMTSVSPRQPFPEAFKPLFPGGWADLAKAEGFQLPKEFEKHKTR